MAPVQVRILPVAEAHDDYAYELAARLKSDGFRVQVDEATDPLGKRVRNAKVDKTPYVLVVGDDDVEANTVGLNIRGVKDVERDVSVDDFAARLAEDVELKR